MAPDTNTTPNPPAEAIDNHEEHAEPSTEVRDSAAVLTKNKELLAENKKFRDLLRAGDFAPTEIEEALKLARQVKEKELIRKGDYDKAKAEFMREHEQRYSTLEKQFNQFVEKNAYKSLIADLTSREMGVRPDLADDFATLLTVRHIAPRVEDGEVTWINKDGVGDAANIAKLVEEYRKTKPSYFVSNVTPGSGASGSNSNGGESSKLMKRSAFESLSPVEQMGFIKSGGKLTE